MMLVVILNCSYCGGLKLRKLVINDWFLELFWGMGEGGGLWFFINNFVGLSMCDSPI